MDDVKTVKTYKGRKLHSYEDQPAIHRGDYCAWYKNGLKHRVNNPAIIDNNKAYYFFNNKLHNPDGPAVLSLTQSNTGYMANYIISMGLHQ